MDWNAIVDQLGPRLFRYFSFSFSSSIAEELVQEVLIRLVQSYLKGRFDPQKGNLSMWAFGFAHHVRLERLRSLQKNQRLIDSMVQSESCQETPSPLAGALSREEGEGLRKAMGQLKDIEQEILMLHIDEELTLTEVAKLLGLPLGTAKSHLHRAKEKLKEMLRGKKE